ncbi:MAG: tRNA (adenosine(37)-N6)-threonylcarbamoyltransferase complex ATPase subunit type 1 TsaE [Pseudomonadota bacterium]
MVARTTSLLLESPDATERFARRVAQDLRPGDTLLLSGPVGAGKSHFARMTIQTLLTEPEDIPSPTYTLVQTYPGPSGEIWHADLYRLSDTLEIVELGLSDAFSTAICIVEWPDRLGTLAPNTALRLAFSATDRETEREVQLSWQDGAWDRRLSNVLSDHAHD